MAIVSFLIHLLGAVMLLLYAVRMVRTGIERAFGASFRRVLTSTRGVVPSAATGVMLAMVLQSSAAVAILVAGFAGTGVIAFPAGLAMVLGADLGSAMLIQILSFPIDWLVPILLALGGGFFTKSSGRALKQAGRILLGIAFILISLRFLRETMDPIRASDFLPAISGYLERDFVTAFLTGAVLAFIMHSSVAVILMCVTLVSISAVPPLAGVSLVMGANMGSALIPVWISRTMPSPSRRITAANFLVRGTGAVLAVIAINKLPILPYLTGASDGQTLINAHIAFNVALLSVVPFARFLEPLCTALFPVRPDHTADADAVHRSVLDYDTITSPQLAISSLKREILRMVQIVDEMLLPVADLYHAGDEELADAIIAKDRYVNTALDGVRRFVANLPVDEMSKEDRKLVRDLAEYAISVESAADVIVKRLVPRTMQKRKDGVQFSDAGWSEILRLHENVSANLGLAANVVISDDVESARLLLEAKVEVSKMERKSRHNHLKRLNTGGEMSFGSSNIHLETLSALKDMNSLITAVAYPILHRNGQLLETRLIDSIDR